MLGQQFSCYYTWCDKSFNSKYNLKRHINATHIGIKKFNCEVCSKKLVSKQNLTEHMYTHTGEKPFRCEEPGCGKSYRQSSQLSVHKKVHKRNQKKLGEKKTKSKEISDQEERDQLSLDGLELPPINFESCFRQQNIKLPIYHSLLI
ncbi:unnamed protein product [Blepharisma stoltei]|uniref:C2H2-type domain-containing protein n=1 Tax=Blepharisma stoltei TaxID=1481888 RepID=A0AAU9ICD3_9CILI|nr:unnamed protein product [Blepharisma stoltei]